jgi:hypothetical protein
MATRYHIEEMRNGLKIRVRHEMLWWEPVVAAGIAGVVVWFVSTTFFGGRWKFIFSGIAAVMSLVASIRQKRAQLTITNVEFLTEGNFSKRFRSGQTVCTGNVRWLEYQEGAGSEDPANEHGGLYAVTTSGKVCLLPFLTEMETTKVIGEIERRFPGLADRSILII